MTDKLMECITNPVKCKLLLEIYSQDRQTRNTCPINIPISHLLPYTAI